MSVDIESKKNVINKCVAMGYSFNDIEKAYELQESYIAYSRMVFNMKPDKKTEQFIVKTSELVFNLALMKEWELDGFLMELATDMQAVGGKCFDKHAKAAIEREFNGGRLNA